MPRKTIDLPTGENPDGSWAVREVPLSELNHQASRILRDVEAGELAVVTRHGFPAAVILPAITALKWAPVEFTSRGDGAELQAMFDTRERKRRDRVWLHGDWWTEGPWID